MLNKYVVPVGALVRTPLIELEDVATSEIDNLDIITNDKVAVPYALSGNGQPVIIKDITVKINDTDGSPTQKDFDIFIFNNLATDVLGISSGAVFALDGTNNTIDNVVSIVNFTTEDFKIIDTNNVQAVNETNIYVYPSQTEDLTFSFALKAREAQTYDASHTIKVQFSLEQL
jgi:hypothetical protein